MIPTCRIYFVLQLNAKRNSENKSKQKYWCLEFRTQTPLWHWAPVLFCYPDGAKICFEDLEQN